jgi:hypothetical protein
MQIFVKTLTGKTITLEVRSVGGIGAHTQRARERRALPKEGALSPPLSLSARPLFDRVGPCGRPLSPDAA